MDDSLWLYHASYPLPLLVLLSSILSGGMSGLRSTALSLAPGRAGRVGGAAVEVQRGLEATVAHQHQPCLLHEGLGGHAQLPGYEAHGLPQRMTERAERYTTSSSRFYKEHKIFNRSYLARIIHESQTRPWDSLHEVL